MAKKVNDVRIEKKQIAKNNFKKKGLPELLSEVKLSIDKEQNETKLIKKTLSSIKRTFKKDFFNRNIVDRVKYFQEINIHPIYNVSIELLNPSKDVEFYNYVSELLNRCQPKNKRTQPENVTVAKVIIQSGDNTKEGYTLLDGEIGGSYHRTSRAFSNRQQYGYLPLFDISSLIAETILTQSLFDFADKNKELVKYLFVERASRQFNLFSYRGVPISEEFKKDFNEIAFKYNFDTTKESKESEIIEQDKNVFYSEVDKIHLERALSHPVLKLVIAEFIRQSNYIQYKTNEEWKARGDYAKAFQTKKHIKKSHQERMNNNVFLNRYGYVELDNDVDLNKFNVIEENFTELCEQINVPKRNDYSFRIKKLGHYKAAGVFFPFFKTTIFDLNHPDSFVHEMYHQIDHILSENKRDDYYSETIHFRSILDKYKNLVKNNVDRLDDEDSFKQQWNGKTKYNKSYYLNPTEVFARCGEIFIAEKGLNNSLLKTKEQLQNDPVYPFHPSLMSLINEFYEQVSSGIAITEEKELQGV